MIICAAAMVYWVLQLKLHDDNGEENKILQRTLFQISAALTLNKIQGYTVLTYNRSLPISFLNSSYQNVACLYFDKIFITS
jgi:hypothetical protein